MEFITWMLIGTIEATQKEETGKIKLHIILTFKAFKTARKNYFIGFEWF